MHGRVPRNSFPLECEYLVDSFNMQTIPIKGIGMN